MVRDELIDEVIMIELQTIVPFSTLSSDFFKHNHNLNCQLSS